MAKQVQPGWAAKSQFQLRPFGVAGLLVLCFVGILYLVAGVWRELVELERLSADNTQWSLMQAEVEFLRLELSVDEAIAAGDAAGLDEVHKWFDVIYSRVAMLSESQAYAQKLRLPLYVADADRLTSFLERTLPLFDGPDAALRASLRGLSQALPEVRQGARRLTLMSRSETAAISDARRAKVKLSLLELGLLTAILLLTLSGLALIFHRLTQQGREQVRQNLLTSARLQAIFSTSADAIIVSNRGGWILDFNPAAEAMFGHSRGTVLGVHALDLLLPPALGTDQRAEILATLDAATLGARSTSEGPLRIELSGLRSDGVSIPVEMSVGTMQVATGGVIVALVRDISDRRQAERALNDALLQAQEGEKAKADFIAVMSHEMRTPLNGLLGSLELLGSTDLQAGQKDLVKVMAASGQILLQHVNSVLDISKAEADYVPTVQTDFDLDRLIEDCVANQAGLSAAKGLPIVIEKPDGPIGWVRSDPARLLQILLNLIGNAVKFTQQGRITIEAERIDNGQVVEIRVIDTGTGIAEEDLDRVFDDFITLDARYDRPAGGTGLGLGIARRVAQAMGGEIGAESVLGDGSLFWLRLPLPGAQSLAQGDQAGPQQAVTIGMRVLVIEDNLVNRFVLRHLLEESGHLVHEANTGAEGVDAAMAQAFDLILTDISMPGMDGVEVARRIRDQGGPSQRARIVAVTAHALDADLARFRAAGMDDCMTKPITRITLAAALAQPVAWAPPQHSDQILERTQIAELEAMLGRDTTAALILRVITEGDAAEAENLWVAEDACEQRLHALAGTAGTFGARALQARLAELHLARAGQDLAHIARTAAGLTQVWQSTRLALLSEVMRLKSHHPLAAAGA